MLGSDDVVLAVVLSTIDISAMLANIFYISIIMRKTTKSLSSYSSLLLNIACVDFLAALCSFMSIPRVKNEAGYVVLVHVGPCTVMGARWCHLFFAGHAIFLGQSELFLTASFAYRLWMLRATAAQEQISRIWRTTRIAVVAVLLPTLLAILLGGSFEVPQGYHGHTICVFNLTGGIGENVIAKSAFLSFSVIFLSGFLSIFAIRHRLFAGINKLVHSERADHDMIFRSLTLQMMLPLVYVGAEVLWIVDLVGVADSQILQRAVLTCTPCFALVSPIINKYYIPPYRKSVLTIYFSSGGKSYLLSFFSTSSRTVPQAASAEIKSLPKVAK